MMNHQDRVDALIGASSPLAEVVEIHNVKRNGMMKMYPVDSLEVPAKGMVMLKPGGYHIMLINLKQAPKLGESHTLTLRFQQAPDVVVRLILQQNETTSGDSEKTSMRHHQSHKSRNGAITYCQSSSNRSNHDPITPLACFSDLKLLQRWDKAPHSLQQRARGLGLASETPSAT